MPYFRNRKLNILYLHIPKTGGTTIEKYLSKLFRSNINASNLYSGNVTKFRNFFYGSPQHQRLCTLLKYRKQFNISLKKLFIFASIRNPYTRAISDLFFFNLINKNTSKEFVYNKLKMFVYAKNKFDNHNVPQYLYFTNNKGQFNKNIKIVRNETLNKDMIKLGFKGFNGTLTKQKGKVSSRKYFNYLNKKSINLINKVYDKDFVLFNYKKITDDIEKNEV